MDMPRTVIPAIEWWMNPSLYSRAVDLVTDWSQGTPTKPITDMLIGDDLFRDWLGKVQTWINNNVATVKVSTAPNAPLVTMASAEAKAALLPAAGNALNSAIVGAKSAIWMKANLWWVILLPILLFSGVGVFTWLKRKFRSRASSPRHLQS